MGLCIAIYEVGQDLLISLIRTDGCVHNVNEKVSICMIDACMGISPSGHQYMYRAKLQLAKLSSKVVELTHLPECFGILLAATLVAY